MSEIETIPVEEFHKRLKNQGVSGREHVALRCPSCGTVQSIALLIQEGCPEDKAEQQIGFSCVGRWNNAGSYNPRKPGEKAGCDWTLGGLFKIHRLEIEKDGERHPMFEIATKEEAQALEKKVLQR